MQKLNRPQLEYMELDAYEQRILTDGLVDVDETNVTFKDIGGLEKELEEVKVSLAKSLLRNQHNSLQIPPLLSLLLQPKLLLLNYFKRHYFYSTTTTTTTTTTTNTTAAAATNTTIHFFLPYSRYPINTQFFM